MDWTRKTLVLVGMLCLMTFMPAGTSEAQQLYGSVTGTVKDESGAAIPGATVAILSTQTALERTTVSNDTGTYNFTNVLPGSYDVKVSLQGFKEFVETGVPVSVNTVSRVEVTLTVGALTETVTVASETQLLQTDKADVSTELKSEAITNLPLAQYRNYQSLMNLVPGATPTQFQNALTDSPGRSLRTYVNGQNPNSNNTKSDGATNVNLWLPHHAMYVAPAETIDTVNISTSSFDAEQGMAGGAAITLITKSGTNEFRGLGVRVLQLRRPQRAALLRDAQDADRPQHPRRHPRRPDPEELALLLRLVRGLLRPLDDADLLRRADGGDARRRHERRTGSAGGQQLIFDPLTGNADGTGRSQFAGNVIPGNRISPVAQEILKYYPLPNLPGNTRNYVRDADSSVDRNNYDVKLNWNRTTSHQIWGKYSQMDAVVSNLFYLGVDGGGSGDTAVKQFTRRPDLDAELQHGPRQHVRLLAAEPGSAGVGLRARQLRRRHARHSRHQRRDVVRRRPALRRLPVVQPRLQRHRQQRRVEPALPRRAHLRVLDERHQADGPARDPRRLLGQLPLPGSLAAR